MAETVNTNQFKNGMHVEIDGEVWRIVEFQHVKPGKGGAFVRTKVKSLDSGSVVDLAQLRAHEGAPLARLDVLELDDLEDLAVDLDVRSVLELIGRDHRRAS